MKLKKIKTALVCLTLITGQVVASNNTEDKSYLEKASKSLKNIVSKPVTIGAAGLYLFGAAIIERDTIKNFFGWENRSNLAKFTLMSGAVVGLGIALNKYVEYTRKYYFRQYMVKRFPPIKDTNFMKYLENIYERFN